MALRYRDDQVISSLRTAYLLKHNADGAFMNSNPIAPPALRELNELEADIKGLDLSLAVPRGNADNVPTTPELKPISPSALTPKGPEGEEDVVQGKWGEGSDYDSAQKSVDPIETRLKSAYSVVETQNKPVGSTQVMPVYSEVHTRFTRLPVKDLGTVSRLTTLLTGDPREQYGEAVAGLKGPGNHYTMRIQGLEPIEITVKPDCSTHVAIGYALFKADVEQGDANMYTLRLLEEDGEIDDDFPALDRVRPIASYQVDEFAILRATEAEYRENCKRTPNKVAFRQTFRQAAPAAPVPTALTLPTIVPAPMPPPTSAPPPIPNTLHPEKLPEGLRRFPSSLSATSESIVLQVYMYPYEPLISPTLWSDVMVTRQTRMQDAFERMCRDKMMDPEMYVLRLTDSTHQIVDLKQCLNTYLTPHSYTPRSNASSVSSTSSYGSVNGVLYIDLEVVALRSLPGGTRPRAGSKPLEADTSVMSLSETPQGDSTLGSMNPGDVMDMQQPFGFYKYSVTRLKVLGGSSKEFVIDGENIHIMPPSDRSMVDQPKTTSFHIRQVVKIKLSKKTDVNFSIVISKPAGLKTYEIECQNSQVAHEIVERLQRLRSARK